MSGTIQTRRGWMYWIAAAACLCAITSWAQNYPAKPVRYVIPFPAGTGNDIVGRLLTDRLTRLWGQQVIVDNRAGASGAIGAAFVAKAPPDGYTLLHCNIAPNAIAPSLLSLATYEHRDFAPIRCLPDDCLLEPYPVDLPWKDGTPEDAMRTEIAA